MMNLQEANLLQSGGHYCKIHGHGDEETLAMEMKKLWLCSFISRVYRPVRNKMNKVGENGRFYFSVLFLVPFDFIFTYLWSFEINY